MDSLRVKLLQNEAIVPTRGTPDSCGLDLYSCGECTINCGERALVPTGLSIKLPCETYGRIAPRSGLALKFGIDVLAGVIDEDYRGEVMVLLINHDSVPFVVKPGDRIAQLIVEKYQKCKIVLTQELDETERLGGFGSTGMGHCC
jgi:dUTP pyrophosphatase